ncbi:MAG: FAD-dependent monooxygenase [Myxococcota bacterium]|nr:FAD-dependent monooxygenase [Myxococcota bacterium]
MSESESASAQWRVLNLPLGLDEDESVLLGRAAERAGLSPEEIRGLRIGHKALDARKRGRPRFVVHVDLALDAKIEDRGPDAFRRALGSGQVARRAAPASLAWATPHASLQGARVVVVGSGPAGLLAALALARSGVVVDVLDRGPALRERGRALARFIGSGQLDPEANLLFGEGGAGTYSDGKIYTRVDHPLEAPILDELVACGAPAEIAYDARAHIGTDRLHTVLPRLRGRMEALGVKFHWGTRLEGWVWAEGAGGRRLKALRPSRGSPWVFNITPILGRYARTQLECPIPSSGTPERHPMAYSRDSGSPSARGRKIVLARR